MSDAGWTREFPTEPGFYFHRYRGELFVTKWTRTPLGPMVDMEVDDASYYSEGVEWWPHPIAQPRDDVVKEDA